MKYAKACSTIILTNLTLLEISMILSIGCSFEDVKAKVPASLLLVTATDGNHGFGVAYLAKLFGCRAKVTALRDE